MKRLLLTVIPALVWGLGVYLRPVSLDPYCSKAPETCTQQSVSQFDRLGMRTEVPGADLLSYYGQNFSAALTIVIPALVLRPTVFTDWNFLFRVAAWNGIFIEISHYLFQRPRPFVYQNIALDGPNPMNYTSFYSGHTSYTAASNVALTLLLIARGVPHAWVLFMRIFGPILILTTAVCRVLAQRHFISDVVAGALAGVVIGWIVFRLHYNKKR
jgi:membrane-associated phospholipid phosphatase